MAQQEIVDDEFTHLWQRHLTALRDDFSATSVQALPSLPSVSQSLGGQRVAGDNSAHPWDEKIESVVEALDELTLQSPNTADTHSPGTPWFPDRDGYTETALSSPLNSSWPRTTAPCRSPNLPFVRADEHSEPSASDAKGKGADTSDIHRLTSTVPFLLGKQLFHDPHTDRYGRGAPTAAIASAAAAAAPPPPTTATTIIHSPTRPSPAQKPPPSQVHVLMLTWAPHPYPRPHSPPASSASHLLPPTPTSPPGGAGAGGSLDTDTESLRAGLKRRGYRVQCRTIPADYPTAAVETMLDRFLERSAPDSLLVVYYRGYGGLEGEGRMLFSSGLGAGASSFFWDDVRDPVMQVPGDVLLIFDCSALPGTAPEQWEMRVEAGMASSASTKQLLGVCVPPDSSGDGPGNEMTQSLCRTLERAADMPVLSVHRLCSLMREDLRGTNLALRVFVSQLGGGQLLDIYLPRLAGSPRVLKQNTNAW